MKIIFKDGALVMEVKVVPNSSRTQVVGALGDALKIKVAQPPEGGKANEAVVEILAKTLGIAVSQVGILTGQGRARKVVRIVGVTEEEARERLNLR